MFNLDTSKTKCKTSKNTTQNNNRVCVKGDVKDDYFQLRMNKEWKDKVKMISELNGVSFSNFIRTSVDKNIQSLSR